MATTKKTVKKEDTPKKDTTKKKTNVKKKEELIDTTTEKEDVKKTTTKKTATKTNGSKTTKTNNTKAKKTNSTKKTEEPSVVDEFLDTVVGETMTQEDADNNENRKKEIKERWEKLGMDEGMQEEVKESVADMYAKQAAELIKHAETGVIGEKGEDGTPYIKDLAETIVFPGIDTDEPDYEKEVLHDFNKEVDKYCEEI